jgi:hypothetical protein
VARKNCEGGKEVTIAGVLEAGKIGAYEEMARSIVA